MNLQRRVLLAICFAALSSQVARADEDAELHPLLTARYSLDLGIFYSQHQLKLRVDSPDGPGTLIDFESEFRAKQFEDMFALNFGWRFGETWRMRAQYFKSTNSQSAVLKRDINWGDVVFGAGSSASATEEFALTRLFFAKDFAKSEDVEAGAGIGLHQIKLRATISGQILDGNGEVSQFREESVGGTVPLPNIGIWYSKSLTPKWAFMTHLDWIAATVDDYEGQLINASVGVDYRFHENVGFGLRYNLVDLDVTVNSTNWKGRWNTTFHGFYGSVNLLW